MNLFLSVMYYVVLCSKLILEAASGEYCAVFIYGRSSIELATRSKPTIVYVQSNRCSTVARIFKDVNVSSERKLCSKIKCDTILGRWL